MQLLRMGWLVHSPLTIQIWANLLGVEEIGWTSVEQFAAFFWGGGYMAGSAASSFHDYLDYQSRVLELWLFPRTRPSHVIKFTAVSIPFYVTA